MVTFPHLRPGTNLSYAMALLMAVVIECGWITPGASADSCPNAGLRTGASASLPDCRAYEQVSPTEKHGADAILSGIPPTRASSTGSSVIYMSTYPFANSVGGELPVAYLSARSEDGWQTSSLVPPTPGASPPIVANLGYDFSADLSQYVLDVPLQNLLPSGTKPEPPAGVYNLYVHHSSRSPGDGDYSLVTTASPLTPLPPSCGECFGTADLPVFAGASSDFSHVIFEENEGLVGTGAPGAPVESLYESTGGRVSLVGILPDGAVAFGGSEPGSGISTFYSANNSAASHDVNHAISSDGQDIVFEAAADGGIPDPTQNGLTELYDRLGGASTIEISAPAEGAAPANSTPRSAQFWAASADGSLVFFTSSAELTTQSNTGSGNASEDLYQYDLTTRTLTDLTVDTNPRDEASGAGVLGVVGTAEDGSYVYFVAKGELLPGEGEDGSPNLYVAHAGQLHFVATLNEADLRDWTSVPVLLKAYVTPDGRHLAFMSINGLTGYDNHDRNNGNEADSEVYEYSADSGQLACASCDPNGARPAGNAFIGAALEAQTSTPFYLPRALSDDGSRLFFSSPDPLSPETTSPFVKIFEYEGGRVNLISSGTSDFDAAFLDASPDGSDVFFATRSQLLPSDRDQLVDVYDARVDGGFAQPPALVPCEGSDCQGAPSTPPVLTAAISATFVGAGDLPAEPPTVKGKAKSKPKAKKKTQRKRQISKRRHPSGKARHARSRVRRS